MFILPTAVAAGYSRILLPQDMQVLHELMQLKKNNRQTGVICRKGGESLGGLGGGDTDLAWSSASWSGVFT